MRHGNIAVRIIEEFLRVRAKSMPVVIYASDRAPGCSMVCPVATLGCHEVLTIFRYWRSCVVSSQHHYQLTLNARFLFARRANRTLQAHWLEKLELQQSLRIHYCRSSGMSIVRLARCLWRSSWLNVVRLYRGPASIQIN